MYEDKIPAWIKSYYADRKYKITPNACIMLADYIGNDLSRIANETEKLLINLKAGEEVNEDLIEKYVGISKEFNVFELQKALGKKDIYKANQIINYFDSNPKKNPIIPIIALLFSFFSKLLLVHGSDDKSEGGVARALGVNPYFAKDYLQGAKVYPAQKVAAIIHDLRKADMMSKGIDNISATEGQILKELIFKILH